MSMGNTVCWVDISVSNLDRAIQFYSAVLGSPVHKESAPGMEFGLLPHFDDNAAGCLVVSPEYPPSAKGPLVYLSVEGRLDAAINAVHENGGKILIHKHPIGPHGFRAVLLDSEGNRIALHSHVN